MDRKRKSNVVCVDLTKYDDEDSSETSVETQSTTEVPVHGHHLKKAPIKFASIKFAVCLCPEFDADMREICCEKDCPARMAADFCIAEGGGSFQ